MAGVREEYEYLPLMTDELLQRYFANQLTPDEARRVLDWFETEAGQRYLLTRLDIQFGHADWHAPPGSPSADPAWHRLSQRLTPAAGPSRPTVHRLGRYSRPLRWAAVLTGSLLIATGGYWAYQQRQPADLIQQTAFGKTRVLNLSDGSVVTLNGNSRLRYAPQWAGGQSREVWLEGEGYFRVAHQPNHEQFVVHLPNRLNIEVLGTQFDVSARPAKTYVVLSTGRIQLSSQTWQANQRVDMRPGELFETTHQSNQASTVVRRRVNPTVYASWQTDRLTFEQTRLADIVQRLEDTYGLHITVSDPHLLDQRFSGTVPNQNADILLDGLAQLFDMHIRRQGNQIFIQETE